MSLSPTRIGDPVNLNHLVFGVLKPGNFQEGIDYVLNEFVSDEGRTSAIRVASDFDYEQFRDRIWEDLSIPVDATLYCGDSGRTTEVTNDSSFHVMLTGIQCGASSLSHRHGLPFVDITSDVEGSDLGLATAKENKDLAENDKGPSYSYIEEHTIMDRLQIQRGSTRAEWALVCAFFNCTNRTMTIQLPGSSTPLHDDQMYTVWRVLYQIAEKNIPAYMLGDDPGLGKTGVSLTVAAIHAMLQETWYDVCAEWNNPSGPKTRSGTNRNKHLPKGKSGNCPSQRKEDVLCPCVDGGLSNRLVNALNPFPTVVVVPPALIGQWVTEASKWIDMEADRSAQTIKVSVYHDSFKEDARLYLDEPAVRSIESQPEKNNSKEGYILHARDKTSSNIIIISSDQAPALLQRFEHEVEPDNDLLQRPSGRQRARKVVQGLGCGIVIFDEFHTYKGSKISRTGPFSMLAKVSKISGKPPMAIGLSASLSKGPDHWRPFVDHAFDNVGHELNLAGVRSIGDFDTRVADFDALADDLRDRYLDTQKRDVRREREEKICSFLESFCPLMMSMQKSSLAFRGHHKWLSSARVHTVPIPTEFSVPRETLMDLKRRVKAWINERYQTEIKTWEDNGKQGAEPNRKAFVNRQIRALSDRPGMNKEFELLTRASLFPSISWMIQEGGIQQEHLLEESIRTYAIAVSRLLFHGKKDMPTAEDKREVTNILGQSPFYGRIGTLDGESSKMKWLKRHIRDSLHYAQANRNEIANYGVDRLPADEPCASHLLVFTEAPVSAFLAFMVLWMEFSGRRDICILYVHSGIDATTRGQHADLLRRSDLREEGPVRVLISTIDDFGEGFDIKGVDHVILTEVTSNATKQVRAFGTAHRLGQPIKLGLHQLQDSVNLAESIMIARNDKRVKREEGLGLFKVLDEDLEYLLLEDESSGIPEGFGSLW